MEHLEDAAVLLGDRSLIYDSLLERVLTDSMPLLR